MQPKPWYTSEEACWGWIIMQCSLWCGRSSQGFPACPVRGVTEVCGSAMMVVGAKLPWSLEPFTMTSNSECSCSMENDCSVFSALSLVGGRQDKCDLSLACVLVYVCSQCFGFWCMWVGTSGSIWTLGAHLNYMETVLGSGTICIFKLKAT